ncbi:hypothetical protein I6E29_08415 [Arcanobacterium haemolyticum]|nr:hypothetical protein [Arcanobacterium haemolyticum]
MSTPTDPYSSSTRRSFDDDDILAPIVEEPPFGDAPASHEGMDPAFDKEAHKQREELAAARAAAEQARAAAQEQPEPAYPSLGAAVGMRTEGSPEPHEENSDTPGGEAPVVPETESTPSPSFKSTLSSEQDSTSPLTEPWAEATSPEAPTSWADADNSWTPESPAAWAQAPTEPWQEPARTPAAVIPPAPRGRGWAHALSVIFTLLLVPLAWYVISDASVRLGLVVDNPWETGDLNFAALGELIGGLAIAAVIWGIARWSSLGATVVGIIVSLAGAAALVVPSLTQDHVLAPLDRAIGDFNDFTANVIHHLTLDLATGRIFIFGVILILTAFVSHSARRRGQATGAVLARRESLLANETHGAQSEQA